MKFLALYLSLSGLTSLVDRDRPIVFRYENVLGTSFELKVLATPEVAQKAETAALAEIDRESAILSGYDPGSEFSRWFRTRGQAVAVSRELYDVLAGFDRYRSLTGGALNPAAETATRLWKQASADGRIPSGDALASAADADAKAPLVAGRRRSCRDAPR